MTTIQRPPLRPPADTAEYVAEVRRRSAALALTPARERSAATLRPFSEAEEIAATNLVAKALRALEREDDRPARDLAERAVRIGAEEPTDRFSRRRLPAGTVALALFTDRCADAIERSARGDDRWLTRVLSALDSLEPEIQDVVAASLGALDEDLLVPPELERIESAMGDALGLSDPFQYSYPEDRADILLGVLRLAIACG